MGRWVLVVRYYGLFTGDRMSLLPDDAGLDRFGEEHDLYTYHHSGFSWCCCLHDDKHVTDLTYGTRYAL